MTFSLILKTLGIGLAAGYLSGQFAIGGGLITTPAIRLLLYRSAAIAIGTPLVVIIPSALTGSFNYWREGLIHKQLSLILSVSGLVGVLVGSVLTVYLSAHFIMVLTAVVILITGVRFVTTAAGRTDLKKEDRPPIADQVFFGINIPWKAGAIGVATGIFSGFLGLGGGVVLVPALVYLFKLEMKQALGTSLVCISFYAIPGSIIHFSLGHVDLTLAMILIAGTIPGAYFGSKVALQMPEKLLKSLFGGLLIILALVFGVSELFFLVK